MGEGDPGVEPEPRKKTPEQSSQNKPEPAPMAVSILVLEGLRTLPERRHRSLSRGLTTPPPVTFPLPYPHAHALCLPIWVSSWARGCRRKPWLPPSGELWRPLPLAGTRRAPGAPRAPCSGCDPAGPERAAAETRSSRGWAAGGRRVPGVRRGRAAAGSVGV